MSKFNLDVSKEDLREVVLDLIKDGRGDIINRIVDTAFVEWNALGDRKEVEEYVAEIVDDVLPKAEIPKPSFEGMGN